MLHQAEKATSSMLRLFQSAANGNVKKLRVAVNPGADVNTRGADRVTALDFGVTAIHQAIVSEQLEALRVSVELGADVNGQMQDGSTALHEAAAGSQLEASKCWWSWARRM